MEAVVGVIARSPRTAGAEYRPEPHSFEETYAAVPRHTVGILTESLNYVSAEVVTTVLAPGVHRRGEVSRRTDLVAAARRAGCSTVDSRARAPSQHRADGRKPN